MNTLTIKNNSQEINIAYNDFGTGDPVILIHGWPLCKEMWEYQVDHLIAAGFRVISYDRRGFGSSSKPEKGYDYDTLTNDLNQIIIQLKLTNVSLVGFSMGGGEVVRYFSKFHGLNVKKVVLISSVTPFLLKTDSNPDGVPAEEFEKMAEAIKNDRPGFLDDFGKSFFGVSVINKPISNSSLEYYKLLACMALPQATLECAKSFSTTDFRNEMSSINVPTLIIHGTDDKTVPVKPTGDEAAKLIKNNSYRIYDGAPHGLWFTHKNQLAKDLVDFLK